MRRLRLALAGILVAAVLIGLVELALRLALGPPPPPVKIYRVADSVDGYFTSDPRGRAIPTYQQNGIEPFEGTPTGPRFAVVGGSSVHLGTRGISTEQEFPGLLAEATGFEVLNLGSPALDSNELAELVAEAVEWELTGLVVYTGHNDIGNTWFMERYGDTSSRWQATALSLLENLQLYVQLRRALSGPVVVELNEGGVRSKPSLEGGRGVSAASRSRTLRYFDKNLRRIAYLCEKHDVELVLLTPVSNVFITPRPDCESPPECAMDYFHAAERARDSDPAQATEWFLDAVDLDSVPVRATREVGSIVRDVAEDSEAELLDTARLLPREAEGLDLPARWLFQDQMHFTPEGHAEMATLLEPVLLEMAEEADLR